MKFSKKWNKRYFGPEPEVPGTPAPAPAPAPPPPPERTFKQAEVDKVVQERLSKANKEKEDLLLRLQDAAKTEADRAAIATQLEDVRAQMMTKEQQAQEALKKARGDRENEIKAEKDRADRYEKTFKQEKVKRELADAAILEKAHRPNQIVDMLTPRARVIDKIGADGKPTGEFETRVKISAIKGKELVELDLTATEAVQTMKADRENHGNLFDSGMVGGMGASGPRTDGKNKSLEEMGQDEFTKRYQQDRSSLGLKKK